jgi:hypothetical protein
VTRKRVARPNPRDQSVTTAASDLAIIDQQSWAAVSERFASTSGLRPEQQMRPKRLLSGLVRCGVCSGPYNVIGRDRWGCGTHREMGTCTNNRSIINEMLERRVLGALRERMLQPEAVAAYIEEYQRDLATDHQRKQKERRSLEKKAAEADRRIARLTLAIADGGKRFEDIRSMLTAQVAERDRCRRELADVDAEPALVLMPNLAERYRKSIEDLSVALSGDLVEVQQAREALRQFVDAVIATPAAEGRGVALEVRGQLSAMLGLTNENSAPGGAAGLMRTVVAGTGFEPVTFRL